jgi:hypothetical protein
MTVEGMSDTAAIFRNSSAQTFLLEHDGFEFNRRARSGPAAQPELITS